MKPEEKKRMSLLLDFYGGLLTSRQKELFEQYYDDDLSLSEVAENTGITRQGVRESIKKAETILLTAEEKLGFYEAWQKRQTLLDALEERLHCLGVSDAALSSLLDALRA